MYKTLSTYDVERGAFMTWVTTITRNLLVDHFRKSKQDRATDSIDAGTSPDEDSLTLADQLEDGGPAPTKCRRSGRSRNWSTKGCKNSLQSFGKH